jgi:hypothetical protein
MSAFGFQSFCFVGFVKPASFSILQLSFQEWTQQMRDMLDARKRGDFAFKDKDFKAAIDCYSQVGMRFLFMKNP